MEKARVRAGLAVVAIGTIVLLAGCTTLPGDTGDLGGACYPPNVIDDFGNCVRPGEA